MAAALTDDPSRIVERALEACSVQLPEARLAAAGGQLSSLFSLGFAEIGFDSLNFMEFCISIAMDSGIELSVEDVARLKTPNAVIEHLSRHA